MDFMEIHHYWIIFGIILLIAEIFTPGFLLASFGIGAFGGSLFAYWDYAFKVQLFVFSVVTMFVFFGIRPLYNKYFHKLDDQRETGVNALIGNNYKVTENINNFENTGRVQVGSESWRARSENNELFETGDLIKVNKVEGSTLFVSSTEKKGS
jgi:membrane protein implicated in regulation of membrane protease activity|tara:strand:- start:34 stop:492 length:459 start_codon:yes stop_codon:yes gene_type:complete